MSELYNQIHEATQAVRKYWTDSPTVGIILGTGLGKLVSEIEGAKAIPYTALPHFPQATVLGHAGELVFGRIGGKSVAVMSGRFHGYEGYSHRQLTFPVRVLKALGCSTLIVSNAAGGLNPQFSRGDIMVIEDHINLMGDNPLIGPNDDRLGVRFPDMSEPYDKSLLALAQRVALTEKVHLQKGVYVAVSGPNLETRAEYRFLRAIGADVVGMSTVPETIVAVHGKMKVVGFSIVTDMCLPDALEPTSHEEILAVANECEEKLRPIVRRLIEEMP